MSEESSAKIEKRNQPFDEVKLQAAWKSFDGNRPEVGKLGQTILDREVVKRGETEAVIHLASQLEVSFLERFESELVQYLREELKNDNLSLKKEVAEIEVANKLYTNKDIFEEMLRQNPKLQELKDRLGLDYEM